MRYAGYTYLIEELGLSAPPLGLELAVGDSSKDEIKPWGPNKIKLLAQNKNVGSTIYEQIETAIHYQGVRFAYLVPIFEKLDENGLTAYILEKPQAVPRRCIWFLYEWLISKELDIESSQANYVELLDKTFYFTSENGVKNPRTRIINNCLGNKDFCPMIRKTSEVMEWSNKNLMEVAQEELTKMHGTVNPDLLGRSVEYLYTKETKSSTEIEKETPAEDKMRKFYQVLKTSGTVNLNKRRLLDIQNEIVRGSKKDDDYRKEEIYVGETISTSQGLYQNIHYIGPRSIDVPSMMNGLIEMHRSLLLDDSLPPMMHAAILSFGFVYIHPFSDGNGRIHRYLIHDVLKFRIKTEQDFIIPVSAAILQRNNEYDTVLEKISKSVMALINYDLNEKDHSITAINNDINYLYRYPDLTDHVLFLYKMMEASITEDLKEEVMYLIQFDAVKQEIEQRYDMPNKELNLMIQLLLQNNGKVANRKRKRFYGWINETNLQKLEVIINNALEEVIAQISITDTPQ